MVGILFVETIARIRRERFIKGQTIKRMGLIGDISLASGQAMFASIRANSSSPLFATTAILLSCNLLKIALGAFLGPQSNGRRGRAGLSRYRGRVGQVSI